MRYWMRVSVFVLLAAALGVGSPLTVLAQDDTNPLCSGLSESDCQLMVDADKAMDGVASFSAPAWRISLTGEADGDTLAFSATGSARFDMTDERNPAAHMIIESASVTGPDGDTHSGGFEAIVKDKMLYLRVDGVWYGGELDMSKGGPHALGGVLDQLEAPEGTVPDLPDLSNLPDLDMSAFLTTTRLPDETLMGQSVAVFNTRLDVPWMAASLIAMPFGQGLLGGALGEQMPMFEQLRPEDLPLIAPFMARLLGETGLDLGLWIGAEDGLYHQIALKGVLDFDPARTPFPIDVGPVMGQFRFVTSIDEIGASFDITPPETYKPLKELHDSGEPVEA